MKKQLSTLHKLCKTVSVLTFALSAFILSGCSASDFILHHSGIMSENDYRIYNELANTDKLDTNSFYIAPELNTPEISSTPPKAVSM